MKNKKNKTSPPQGAGPRPAPEPTKKTPRPHVRHRLWTSDLLRLSLRTFKTKPARTFLTVLGMSFGIGTVLFLISLGYGLQFTLIGKLVSTEDSLITLEMFYPSETGLEVTDDDLDALSLIPAVAETSPVGEFAGEINRDDAVGLVITRIVEPNYFRLSGEIPNVGSPLKEGEEGIIVSNSVLKLAGLLKDEDLLPPAPGPQNENVATPAPQLDVEQYEKFLGETLNFTIFLQDEQGIVTDVIQLPNPLPIVGVIVDELQPPFAFIPRHLISKPLPFYNKVLVKARDAESVEPLRDALLEKGYLISARIDLVKQATKVMRVITIVLGIFGITALVVAAVGMFNTMIVSFLERTFEVGILKALGATDGDVRNLFLTESFMMGVLGGALGIVVGYGSTELVNFGLNLLAHQLGGQSIDIFITPLWFIGLILGFSSLIGIVAGFWPAYKATQLPPKQAFTRK
ncbi:MAG: ABC transporter permease [Nanoarchaeota archaeon]|nr:ABC transporter permease [Nanoarchaeota archaeon]